MKPTKTMNATAADVPEIHPTSGGSWMRDPVTGTLTKQQVVPPRAAPAEDAPAVQPEFSPKPNDKEA